ncbi:MAG: hypothetical protein FK734_15930 [Asgard group archaeon]|nr:hypothetical protein [Asgard group archaeon]
MLNQQFIKDLINETIDLLKSQNYTIVKISASELIAYFEGDAPSGDTTTLNQVLDNKWLLIHELVEINELKQLGFEISSKLLFTESSKVFEAHLVAIDWELHFALNDSDINWISKRLDDVRNWLKDPDLSKTLHEKCQALLLKYESKLKSKCEK